MNNKLHAKFQTPGETILNLTRDIIAGKQSPLPGGASHYRRKINYEKARSLLVLALKEQLGQISDDERNRIASALEKLDELYKKNRRLPRRPPPMTTGQLNL